MPNALPSALIFDLDGLLVDTETCDYEAWRELHEEQGLELTLAEYCQDAGLYGSWERRYAALSEVCGVSPEELHSRREPRFLALVEECLRPSPELLALLELLRRHDIGRAVASSSDAEWVARLLGGLGLEQEFQAVATGDDVVRRKPAPDVYLLAAKRLGIPPQRCVALEDSTHGVQAAQAAGLRVVAIPNPVSSHQDLSAADARVAHFGEITLDLLRRLST